MMMPTELSSDISTSFNDLEQIWLTFKEKKERKKNKKKQITDSN